MQFIVRNVVVLPTFTMSCESFCSYLLGSFTALVLFVNDPLLYFEKYII